MFKDDHPLLQDEDIYRSKIIIYNAIKQSTSLDLQESVFSNYFYQVMLYLDRKNYQKLIKKNVNQNTLNDYKRVLVELTRCCVSETTPNYLLGASEKVLSPIYDKYAAELVFNRSSKSTIIKRLSHSFNSL